MSKIMVIFYSTCQFGLAPLVVIAISRVAPTPVRKSRSHPYWPISDRCRCA